MKHQTFMKKFIEIVFPLSLATIIGFLITKHPELSHPISIAGIVIGSCLLVYYTYALFKQIKTINMKPEREHNATAETEPQDFPDINPKKELEELKRKNLSEAEYFSALIALINRITDARNFYKEKCERLEVQKIQTWEKKMN